MLPRLLDRLFSERGSALRTADLASANQQALLEYDWPHNFDDLQVVADRIEVLAREGSLRKAAESLGMNLSTFHYWLTGIGLTLPLLASR
jgi:DNA-binding NtrC family response regulator